MSKKWIGRRRLAIRLEQREHLARIVGMRFAIRFELRTVSRDTELP
jgi:hypothetical protein